MSEHDGVTYQMSKGMARSLQGLILALIAALMTMTATQVLTIQRLGVSTTDLYAKVERLDDTVQERDRWQETSLVRRSALEASEDVYVQVDEHGIVTLWSIGAENFFGITRSQAMGFGLSAIMPSGNRERHIRGFGSAMASQSGERAVSVVECSIVRDGGTEVPVKITVWYTPGVLALGRVDPVGNETAVVFD